MLLTFDLLSYRVTGGSSAARILIRSDQYGITIMAIKEHVRLHRLYSSQTSRIIRLSVLVILLILVLLDLTNSVLPKTPLFFLSLGVMWEVFFHFSLSRLSKGVTIQQFTGTDRFQTFSHAALDSYFSGSSGEALCHELLRYPQIQFMLERMEISDEEFPIKTVSLEEISKLASEIAGTVSGRFVTTMDLFAAYLMLSEPETKLLFMHELKKEDVENILVWARRAYPHEEAGRHYAAYTGDGFGEVLVDGWTPETQKYTTDFTLQSLRKGHGMVGREAEYEMLVNTLTKAENRNALLIGEAGVGKEKLVATLAQKSQAGSIMSQLNHKRFLTLMVGPLLAGTSDRAELESRLQALIAELTHAGNIILCIPELQEIMGESSYNINLSGALLPYLKDGNLPIIATMTKEHYKTSMEKNGLNEVFTVITLDEPTQEEVKRILFVKLIDLEKTAGVIVPYKTLLTVLKLCTRYLPDDVLPGSAVRLLTDAIQKAGKERILHHKRVVTTDVVTEIVEGKVHAKVSAPKGEEKTLLLHMEETLHNRVIGQDMAISVIAEAMRRLRSGVGNHERPISFLFLGPTGVGKTETAKALSEVYFGGEDRMLRLDMSEYVDSSSVQRLLGATPGSGDERGELTDKIHDNPYTLVLLDEFEKAHPSILDLFLQVLSDGRLTDNKGRTVSFTDSIIIATSNAGALFIREALQDGKKIDRIFQASLLKELEVQHVFKPELLNRFDGIVTFQPLSDEQLQQVTKLLLADVAKQMQEKDIRLVFDEQVVSFICQEGHDEQFGARPLRRYIQDTIEAMLATLTLEEKIQRGDTVRFSMGTNGMIMHTISHQDASSIES